MAVRETIELLLVRDMPSIRGNHDRWLVETDLEDMESIDRVAFAQLDAQHLDWLRNLPATLYVTDNIFLCHGTPGGDTTYWQDKVSPHGDVIPKPRDEIAVEAQGIEASLLLCGHTHLPRRVDLPDGRVILNPGSVDVPGTSTRTPSITPCKPVLPRHVRRSSKRSTTVGRLPSDTCRMIQAA